MTQDNNTTDSRDVLGRLDEAKQDKDDVDREAVLGRFGRPGDVDRLSGDVLECAGCGSSMTHQFKAEVFFRDAEDSGSGVHVEAARGRAVNGHDMSGNPSERRDGLSVWFTCELCSDVTRMDVAQHKGETYVDTTVDGDLDIDEAMSL